MRFGLYNIIRNTGSTVVIRGLFGVARIILLLLIARKFGPAEFGRLSLVLSIIEIVRVFADFGVDLVSIRRFSVNRLLSERLLSNVLSLKLINASAGYVISAVAFWFVYQSAEGLRLLLIVAASLYTSLLLNAFASYFQANLSMSRIIASSIVSALSYVSLTLYGLYAGWPLESLAAIIPVSEAINLLMTARIYGRSASVTLRFDRRIILSLLKEGLPVAAGGIAVVVYSRLDNLMLGWFLGEKGVGEYAASYRLTEPFTLIFSSLSLSLFAYMSLLAKTASAAEVRRVVFNAVAVVAALGLAAAIIVMLFSRQIMNLISPAYSGSVMALRILGFLIIFKAVNAQFTAFVNSKGRYGIITAAAFFNLTVNIVLNLLMVPGYGIIGAAMAITVTEGLNTIIQCGIAMYLLNFTVRGFNLDGKLR